MLKRKITYIIILIILFAGVVIWEFWPQDMVHQNLSYNPDINLFEMNDCIERSGIMEEQWKLEFPRKMELEETSKITLTKNPNISHNEIVGSQSCELSVLTHLDIVGAYIDPGDKIFVPYVQSEKTQISWDLLATSNNIVGNVWLYAQSFNQDENEISFPLFVIPIEIKVLSVFGHNPRKMRIISVAVIFLSLMALLLKKERFPE